MGSVKNLIDYFPIIWNDRDWDQGYLFDLLEYKLKRMEKFFNSDDACTETAKDHAKEMRETLDALELFHGEDILTKEWEEHYEKYGRPKWEELELDNEKLAKKGFKRCRSYNEKCKDDEALQEECNNEMTALFTLEEEKRTECLEYAFNIMKKHIQSWWD